MSSSSGNALETLNAVVSTTLELITQLHAAVKAISKENLQSSPAAVASAKEKQQEQQQDASSSSNSTTTPPPPEALSLAHDSATLIRAHSTKISLLIINEPFTPTAITKVLRELVAGPIPGLASAAQLCTAERYTQVIRKDLAGHVESVLEELQGLLRRVPSDGKVLSGAKKDASVGAAAGKGSIAATGTLWAACDKLMVFAKRGFAGNLVKKVDEWRETLEDIKQELDEFKEEVEEGCEDDDADDDDVNEVTEGLESTKISDDQDALDDLMNPTFSREERQKILAQLPPCIKRLRLTILLFKAVVKRRLKPLSALPPSLDDPNKIPQRLNEIMPLLHKIREEFNDLAEAFNCNFEPSERDTLMDQCFLDGFAVAELLAKTWDGQKDEFTDWAMRYQVEIKIQP